MKFQPVERSVSVISRREGGGGHREGEERKWGKCRFGERKCKKFRAISALMRYNLNKMQGNSQYIFLIAGFQKNIQGPALHTAGKPKVAHLLKSEKMEHRHIFRVCSLRGESAACCAPFLLSRKDIAFLM